jgi:hypothetical protein
MHKSRSRWTFVSIHLPFSPLACFVKKLMFPIWFPSVGAIEGAYNPNRRCGSKVVAIVTPNTTTSNCIDI